MADENIILDKSFEFAVRIVNLYRHLTGKKQEYILSKQMVRSGTAIGALVREAQYAESRADFVHKMSIALKEANETLYWIELLHRTSYLEKHEADSIEQDALEIKRILISIVKKGKYVRNN
jgi:four helix bundle protein